MGAGVEYRDIDGIIEAYTNYDKPNFSIWAGPALKVKYEGGNMDMGNDMLRSFLTQIQHVGTTTVYALRVYPENMTNITNKTPYEGSFSFMLGDTRLATRGENGVIIMPGQQSQGKPNTAEIVQLNTRLEALERELNNEREKRHKAELDNLEQRFTAQIAGLNQEPEKDKWEKIGELVVEKPEIIDKVFSGLGSMIDRFFANRNAQPQPVEQPAINGTKTNQDMGQEQEEQETELTPEAQELDDRMNDALDKIEHKIGTQKMVEALEKIAEMGDIKLKSLLAML